MQARVIVILTAVAVALCAVNSALAHGTYPSEHHASATCYKTQLLGTWTVMSNLYMNRADGFPPSTFAMGGGDYIYGSSWQLIDGNTQQWLYYRVVVASETASGWKWTYGNWIARQDALGDHTDGISTYFQMQDGSWRLTGY